MVAKFLKVNEIFLSIQGEGTRMGLPCAFVRLTGCNLRCAWCDTKYAYFEGSDQSIEQVLTRVSDMGCRRVEITGGEPLIQEATVEFMQRLCELGYQVLLETNGSLDISGVDKRVARIVDFKCPSSGQSDHIHWPNVQALSPTDEAKFVLADRYDFDFAGRAVREHNMIRRCPVVMSPVHGRLSLATLAKWILDSGLDVRLGLQLHKVVWPDVERGV